MNRGRCPVSELGEFAFAGTAAVVTGAGSGIGRAIARELARRSVNVLVSDVDEERARTVATEIRESRGTALAQRCDVARQQDLEAAGDRCLAEFGRVDIVVNNVGVMVFGRPEAIPLPEWQRVVDLNLLSIVRSNQVFLPLLLKQGSGHVVNTASASGIINYAYDRSPYAATKAAVVALSENLFLYLRQYGIGVSCLCPAGVKTNITEHRRVIGEPLPVGRPDHAVVAADVVGRRVADAIAGRRFLVFSVDSVGGELRRKGQDPDGYLREREARLPPLRGG